MRDPERIDRILTLLEQIWRDGPDLRLGQILANANDRLGERLFYFEDDQLESNLIAFKKILESYGPRARVRDE